MEEEEKGLRELGRVCSMSVLRDEGEQMEPVKGSKEQWDIEGQLRIQCLIEQEKKSFPQEGIDLLCILAP